jgi:hypothetical protein
MELVFSLISFLEFISKLLFSLLISVLSSKVFELKSDVNSLNLDSLNPVLLEKVKVCLRDFLLNTIGTTSLGLLFFQYYSSSYSSSSCEKELFSYFGIFSLYWIELIDESDSKFSSIPKFWSKSLNFLLICVKYFFICFWRTSCWSIIVFSDILKRISLSKSI